MQNGLNRRLFRSIAFSRVGAKLCPLTFNRLFLFLALVGAAPLGIFASDQPAERHLKDFLGPGEFAPDKDDPQRDDSALLQRALNAGPGKVRLDPGTLLCRNVSVPSGVMLVGSGSATIIRSRSVEPVFAQKKCRDWTIRDLVVEGKGEGNWHLRDDAEHVGILIDGCHAYEISGVTLRNFDGAALQITHTNLADAAFSNGGKLERITAVGNHTGVRFGVRGEYVTATQLNCSRNIAGCVINAGNTNIAASNFCGNFDGLILEDRENGSHGTIQGCLLNHNERYALRARTVDNGMTFSGCCFYYGAIELRDCSGVNMVNGQINCHVTVLGKSANRFAGNLIVPDHYQFRFDQATLLHDNFSKVGAFSPRWP